MKFVQSHRQAIKTVLEALSQDGGHEVRGYLRPKGVGGNSGAFKMLNPLNDPMSVRVGVPPLREELQSIEALLERDSSPWRQDLTPW